MTSADTTKEVAVLIEAYDEYYGGVSRSAFAIRTSLGH